MTTPYREPDVRDEYPKEKKPMRNQTKALLTALTIPPIMILCGFLYDLTRPDTGLRSALVMAAVTLVCVLFMRAITWVPGP